VDAILSLEDNTHIKISPFAIPAGRGGFRSPEPPTLYPVPAPPLAIKVAESMPALTNVIAMLNSYPAMSLLL
jgi:hypothetical protein